VATIKVSVTVALNHSAESLFQAILDTQNWESFEGFGPLPGIKNAEFINRTSAIIGSQIKVTNRDGSCHIETITHWEPPTKIEMSLGQFTPPLSHLASHFSEQWLVDPHQVTRSMTMHAKSIVTVPLLWLISLWMKPALKRHTELLGSDQITN